MTPAATARSRSSCATTRATPTCPADSDATWQAYNAYGGNSLYSCTVAVPGGQPAGLQGGLRGLLQPPWDGSFATDGGFSYLWYAEYQMIRFLEENGYNVSYTAQADLDRTLR